MVGNIDPTAMEQPFAPVANGPDMAQNDLELEILLRGNLLQQQQQRIAILELSLSNTCNEIQKYREQLQDMENDKALAASKPQPKVQSRYWTAEEHHQFLIGLEKYGPRDVKSIAALVGTRNATQVRTHAQKYFLRQARENGEITKPDGASGNDNDNVSRKRAIGEVLDSKKNAVNGEKALEADELLPAPPEAPKEVGHFQDGFSAALGYTGTDFDTALHDADGFPQLNSTFGSGSDLGIGDDSPLHSNSGSGSKGPMLKRMKERMSRSTSPMNMGSGIHSDIDEVEFAH